MTYDADNRLASFKGPGMTSYQNVGSDLDGNLTSAPLPIGSSTIGYFTNLTYDARNCLLNAGGVTNFYDALNNRVGQTIGTNTTTYVINPNAALPQVLMRVKNGLTTYYIYGAGWMYQIAEGATATNTLTYHYDYRGSTVALSADNGLVTDRIEYSLYGSTTYVSAPMTRPFCSMANTACKSMPMACSTCRRVYCNPYLCRFISPDPSGFAGGLNFYAYANGNPVSYIDPFGLGALGESALTSSWFDAPTQQQTAIQNGLADFANLVTFGIANEASTGITGTDLYGNRVAPEEQRTAGINLAASLIPVVDIEGVGARVASDVGDTLAGAGSRTAKTFPEGSFSIVDWSGYPAYLLQASRPIQAIGRRRVRRG